MDTDLFWTLIEQSRIEGVLENAADSERRCKALAAALQRRLAELPPDESVTFDRIMVERLDESYRWDLWAVAYIVNGGCSDDDFDYFRGWLIAEGREFYEAVLASPERVGERAMYERAWCESVLGAAFDAYETHTGEEMSEWWPPSDADSPSGASEPQGVEWEPDDLPCLYPVLCKQFGWPEDPD